jgi:hypothetical protein
MTDRHDPLADAEAEAAAAEAAAIGGTPTREDETYLPDDPAMVPVYEGGGGEQEGFEMAEGELIEHAEHGPATPVAEVKALRAEVDRGIEDAAVDEELYAEPDREHVTENVDDPEGH